MTPLLSHQAPARIGGHYFCTWCQSLPTPVRTCVRPSEKKTKTPYKATLGLVSDYKEGSQVNLRHSSKTLDSRSNCALSDDQRGDKKVQESSIIHSASPQSRPAVIFAWYGSFGAEARTDNLCENSDHYRPGLWSAAWINNKSFPIPSLCLFQWLLNNSPMVIL